MPGGRPKDPHARRNAFCLRLSDAELAALERARGLDPADRRGADFVDWARIVLAAYAGDRLGRQVTRAGLRPRSKAAVASPRRKASEKASGGATRREELEPRRRRPPSPAARPARRVPLVKMQLEDFSARVKEAMRDAPRIQSTPRQRGAWFGDDKVFIVALWHQLGGAKAMPLKDFKTRVVAAHVARLLTLARADLVEAMHPLDVSESEATYQRATFHFVRA